MNRKIVLLATFLLFCCLPVAAKGQEFEEGLLEKSGAESMYESLGGETKELLSQVGVEEVSLSAGPGDLFSAFSELLREKLGAPFRTLAALIAVLILCRLAGCSEEAGNIVPLAGAAGCAAVTAIPLLELIRAAGETAEGASVFLLASVPVCGALLTASGSAAAGSSYSFLTLAAGNLIPILTTSVILPMLRAFLALALVTSVSQVKLERFTGMLYGGIKWLLVLSVTVFSGVLSVQTMLNAQVDAAANKAVKLVASTAIPIVGGAFGDAVAAIQNSVQIVKSGVGAFGILAALCLFAPLVIESALWAAVCSIGQLAGELLEVPKLGGFLGACASVAKTILAVLAAICAVCVVCAAILLFVKGSL